MAIYTAYRYDVITSVYANETGQWNPDNGPMVAGWTLIEPPAAGQYQIHSG